MGTFMGILKTIFGAGDVVKAGFDLIDDVHTSKAEEIQEKVKGKIGLLNAYAPFKVMQRVLASLFAVNFLLSFWLVLIFTLNGKIEKASDVLQVLNMFYMGEIMLAIIIFYFGGGFLEGSLRARNEGKSHGLIK